MCLLTAESTKKGLCFNDAGPALMVLCPSVVCVTRAECQQPAPRTPYGIVIYISRTEQCHFVHFLLQCVRTFAVQETIIWRNCLTMQTWIRQNVSGMKHKNSLQLLLRKCQTTSETLPVTENCTYSNCNVYINALDGNNLKCWTLVCTCSPLMIYEQQSGSKALCSEPVVCATGHCERWEPQCSRLEVCVCAQRTQKCDSSISSSISCFSWHMAMVNTDCMLPHSSIQKHYLLCAQQNIIHICIFIAYLGATWQQHSRVQRQIAFCRVPV